MSGTRILLRGSRILLPLMILCFVASVYAQSTGGNIRGVISDAEGKPLPGVTVTVKSKALIGNERTTYTSEAGVFRFPSLPVGTYSIVATLSGFEKVQAEKVEVTLDGTSNVPITMNMAKMTEAVTILGETPIIDVASSEVQTNYKGPLLEEIPTQHSQFQLMQLTPGVSASFGDAGGDRTIAFGSNMQSNSWHVDGVDLSAPETGSVWFTLNPDLIEEIQVTSGASAEYGNYTGAVFNVVTKKGSNEFHGAANWYILEDGLTGTSVDLSKDDPSIDPDIAVFNRLEYRQITGQVGGPIAKDRLWFFGGIQSYRDASAQPGVDPEFAAQAPYKSDKYDAKITSRIGEKHELNGFFHWDNWDSPNSPDPFTEPSALAGEGGRNPAWGANWTSTLSQNFLFEAGYSGWWSDDIYDSVVGAPLTDPFIDYTPPGGGPALYSGGVWYPWDYKTWRSTFRGKATYYAEDFLKSQHEFKFGVQYSQGSANTNISVGVNGFYTYSYYGYLYRVYQEPFQYGGDNRELGLFLDDTITVNDRLTLNVGVRFDHNTGDFPDYQRLTIGTPSISPAGNFTETGETIPGQEVVNWNIVSPRVGFTFQPTANGRSKIEGQFGVYYDHNVSGNWDYPPPGLPPIEAFFFNPDTNKFDLPYYTIENDLVVSSNIDPPRSLQYSLGFEQQFGNNTSAGVQYIHKDTDNLVGWKAIGGVYEPFLFTDPFTGNQLVLFNIIEAPIITKGNDPGDLCSHLPQATACTQGDLANGYFQDYDAVLLTFQRRFNEKWGFNANYTWSRSEGLIPRPLTQGQFNPFYGSRDGSDLVNHYVNARGRLQGDRPHMFRAQAVFFKLPLDLQASVLANFETGKIVTRQIRTADDLGRGRTVIILERDLRLDTVETIDLTVGRKFNLGSSFRVRLEGSIYNLLNSDNELQLATQRLQNPGETFTPDFWTQPRRLEVRLGLEF